MITAEQLKQFARKNALRPDQQEKDYALRILLKSLYQREERPLFKGGTCLRFCYGLNRFSEDLDFSMGISPARFQSLVHQSAKALSDYGIDYEFRKEELFEKQGSYTCTLRFRGPLWTGKPQFYNSINIDAGKRAGVILAPEWKLVGSEYPDLDNFMAHTMQIAEIFAEKASALFTRKKGRDLYDVWFLAQKGVALDKGLFERKLGLLKEKPALTLIGKEEYERDMAGLVPRLVPYEQVAKEVSSFLLVHNIRLK